MKITGYRSLGTVHEWGRPTGDINGHTMLPRTDVHVLVLETDAGLEGVALGPHPDVDRVFPAIEGEDPRAVSSLYDRMLDVVFKSGHGGATFGSVGALDTALWDLKAKMAEQPLWRLLGGRDRLVEGYASGLDVAVPDEDLPALYAPYAERGFTAAKLKGGRDLAADRDRLLAVREVMSRRTSRPAMMIDANESWHATQAIRYVSELERVVDLAWVEEPVRRWDAAGLARVGAGVRAGVASGENLTGLEQLRPLLEARALDVVQPGTIFGITHALRVAHLAHAHDLPVSPVAHYGNALAHVMTAVPNHLSHEVQALSFPRGISVDQELADGGIVLGEQPGVGFTLDEAAMRDEEGIGWVTQTGPHVRPARAGLRLTPDVPDTGVEADR